MNIKDVVSSTISKYGSRNPFDIIKGMKNVLLVYAPLDNIRGFYQYFKRNHIIYIDEELSEHEKIFVCAHELGHLLLHKNENRIFMDNKTSFNTSKYELEANLFALYLLIPDELFYEHREYTISQLSNLLGYSERMLELRLK